MRHDRKRVEPVSVAEQDEAIHELRELTGFAVSNTEREIFLKCAFRTGDISTVWVHVTLAGDLFWHRKRLLQDRKESEGSPFQLATDVGAASFGLVSPSPDPLDYDC